MLASSTSGPPTQPQASGSGAPAVKSGPFWSVSSPARVTEFSTLLPGPGCEPSKLAAATPQPRKSITSAENVDPEAPAGSLGSIASAVFGEEDLAGVRAQVQRRDHVRGRQRRAVHGPAGTLHEELAAGRKLGVREREHAARGTRAADRAVLQALAGQRDRSGRGVVQLDEVVLEHGRWLPVPPTWLPPPYTSLMTRPGPIAWAGAGNVTSVAATRPRPADRARWRGDAGIGASGAAVGGRVRWRRYPRANGRWQGRSRAAPSVPPKYRTRVAV